MYRRQTLNVEFSVSYQVNGKAHINENSSGLFFSMQPITLYKSRA